MIGACLCPGTISCVGSSTAGGYDSLAFKASRVYGILEEKTLETTINEYKMSHLCIDHHVFPCEMIQ